MKSIVPKPLWFVPIAALTLLGAGCFSPEPTPVPPTNPPTAPAAPSAPVAPSQDADGVTTEPTIPSEPAVEPGTSPTVPSGFQLQEIDDTWLTYTNNSLAFSFRYPTKGRYAPTWGVTFVKADDAKMKDGCYQGDADPRQNAGTLFVGDSKFCVTRYEDTSAEKRGLTDFYALERKGTIVLITFSKQSTNDDNFDIGVYNATLDQIVGTFQETE